MRLVFALVIAVATACAQGLEPRASAAAYPGNAKIGELLIGAEFLGRALPAPDGMLNTRGYVVVEAAIYGPALARATLSPSLFSLRVNGSKQTILAQQPFIAATAFDPPRPGTGPSLTVGTGDVGVIFGDPGRRQPLPDPSGTGIPPAPRREVPPDVPKKEPIPPAEAVKRAALPSGELKLPQAGVLFFAYPGDLAKIRTLELVFEGPAGKGSIKLR